MHVQLTHKKNSLKQYFFLKKIRSFRDNTGAYRVDNVAFAKIQDSVRKYHQWLSKQL